MCLCLSIVNEIYRRLDRARKFNHGGKNRKLVEEDPRYYREKGMTLGSELKPTPVKGVLSQKNIYLKLEMVHPKAIL